MLIEIGQAIIPYFIYNQQSTSEMQKEQKPKKEKFRKYQYTKPYKERDKSKDFGKDIPLKKSGRLKFPEKPQYYTLYTVPKLKPDHPFFNIRNKNIEDVKRAIEQTKKQLQKQNKNNKNNVSQPSEVKKDSSCLLRSSAFGSTSRQSKSFSAAEHESNVSSLGVVTISSKKSKENPFSQGFTVTSGPKVYAKVADKSESRDISRITTPLVSVLSGKQMKEPVSGGLSLSGLSCFSEHLSI